MYVNRAGVTSTTASARTYASFWRRFFAYWVDGVIIIVASIALEIFGAIFIPDRWRTGDEALGIGTLVETVLFYGYLIWFTARGATLGKMALGIIVIGPDDGPPGLARAAKRCLVIQGIGTVLFYATFLIVAGTADDLNSLIVGSGVAIILLFAWFLFTLYDYLSMLWHPENRTIHDRIGGTWVVQEP